jgi:hypothetical protein
MHTPARQKLDGKDDQKRRADKNDAIFHRPLYQPVKSTG